jgi:hypothetical protein
MSDATLAGAARAEVRSVLAIAEHIVRLKERVLQFLDQFSASQRGYFTPTEDEHSRQLLVSYWQSRNALLELVSTYQAEEIEGQGDPVRFLAAFGGALVLLDAARFIRDEMHDKPVVRQKLNEPEPHFGIEEGCYDQIQKSLTSPVHAWHLYHANHHFEGNQAELRKATEGEPQTRAVFELVERLRDRLNVSAARFATARARVQARRLRTSVSRDVVGRAMYGLQKAVSSLVSDIYTRPRHVPQLPDSIVAELEQLLEPGDILVTRKDHAATNYFLPGFWPHAALFVGDAQRLSKRGLDSHDNVARHWHELQNIDTTQTRRVVEAMKDGVRMRSLAITLKCDAITVLRARLEPNSIDDVLVRAFFHVGKAYDFDFDFSRSDRMVCSEVVYRSYDGVGKTEFELKKRAGRLTLAPEDIMRMALDDRSFDVVACYASRRTDALLRGDGAKALVQDTIGC